MKYWISPNSQSNLFAGELCGGDNYSNLFYTPQATYLPLLFLWQPISKLDTHALSLSPWFEYSDFVHWSYGLSIMTVWMEVLLLAYGQLLSLHTAQLTTIMNVSCHWAYTHIYVNSKSVFVIFNRCIDFYFFHSHKSSTISTVDQGGAPLLLWSIFQ